nr:hypothetical protein [uncultured Flavobacterium sp.]
MRILKLLVVLSLLAFMACSVPSYTLKNPVSQPGLDFSQGRWLLNDEGTGYNYQQIYKVAKKDFGKQLGDRLNMVSTTSGLMLQKKIPFNPTKAQILEMYNGTQYDYLINIKTRTIKDELATVDLTNHNIKNNDERINSLALEVYDLKRGEIIYSQTAQGVTSRNNKTNSDVTFYRSNDGMLIGCYNKIFKDIKSKSIK